MSAYPISASRTGPTDFTLSRIRSRDDNSCCARVRREGGSEFSTDANPYIRCSWL
jgi:hypothetical protein